MAISNSVSLTCHARSMDENRQGKGYQTVSSTWARFEENSWTGSGSASSTRDSLGSLHGTGFYE